MEFNSSSLFHILKNSSNKFETCPKIGLKKFIITKTHAVTVSGNIGTAAWRQLMGTLDS